MKRTPRTETVHDPGAEREPPLAGWRSEVARASGLNVVLGVWLIASPWVLDYADADARVLSVVLGAAVAALALIRALRAPGAEWLSWANAVIGGGLPFSMLLLADSRRAVWNAVVVGILIVGLATWSAAARSSHGRELKPRQ